MFKRFKMDSAIKKDGIYIYIYIYIYLTIIL